MSEWTVSCEYEFTGSFAMDDAIHAAAGRISDFAGAGMGKRDLGWNCRSEFEAQGLARKISKIGVRATIKEPQP